MAHGGPVYKNPTPYLTCKQRCCQVWSVSFEIPVVNVVATFPWKAQTETCLALERTRFFSVFFCPCSRKWILSSSSLSPLRPGATRCKLSLFQWDSELPIQKRRGFFPLSWGSRRQSDERNTALPSQSVWLLGEWSQEPAFEGSEDMEDSELAVLSSIWNWEAFGSHRAGVRQEMGVRSWSGHADMILHSFAHPVLHTDWPTLLYTHLYIAFRFPSRVSDRDPFPQSLTEAHIPRDIFLYNPMFFTLPVAIVG